MSLTLPVVLSVLSGASAMSLYQTCTSNRDCTEPNTYCYPSGRCVDCTDCSLYNRAPGTVCAKDKNQCGKCLPGMDTEYNLDGTLSCNPSGTSTSSTQTPGPDSPDTIITVPIILAVVAVLLICLCVCIFILCKYTNRCVIIRNIFSFCPNNSLMNTGCPKCPDSFTEHPQMPAAGPPPYSERIPTAPPFDDPPAALDPAPPICQKVYTAVQNDPSQTANAYINPQYIRGGNLGTNPDPTEPEEEHESAEDDALINATSISHPDDEETQPSTWTPSSGSDAGSAIGPTSFQNALSLQQLRISQPDVTTSVQQGASARSNSHPSIQFNSQQSDSSDDRAGGAQQNNIINVGIFINQSK